MGHTTGQLRYDRLDSAYAIGGTAELALRYSPLVSASDDRTKALISDYGPAGLLEQGNAAASAGAAGPFYGTTGRRKQRATAAKLMVQQDYGPTGSSGRRRRLRRGRSTSKGLPAGRTCQMAMLECTVASG